MLKSFYIIFFIVLQFKIITPNYYHYILYRNIFNLKLHTLDIPDFQETFNYDSRIKCVALCSAMDNCHGCNYHYELKRCTLFANRTKLVMKFVDVKKVAFYMDIFTHIYPEITNRYIGCYVDQIVRDLEHLEPDDYALTNEKCWKICSNYNYSIFATQFRRNCFCSTSFGRYGPGNGCTMTCWGAQDQICGGSNMNSLYSICDRGMYGLNCSMKCPCGVQCFCHRLNGSKVV
ncbi:hypothetical protein HELRODRAFT_174596 [Helobdella robusta]|uniref:WSC domain-containing protein n=1 Tax=Helobdella robusta TaxID=6412 RepID=T1F8A4_HELRO|nr:hypothetical protein HELRODRAFT_174596 [Helobdella robusta]ESO01637.1 hypothetical protein HELRODRAFT_174596 [Helobdella robusta]